jgi:hypothetical protein
MQVPTRLFQSTCPWGFGDGNCAVSGGTAAFTTTFTAKTGSTQWQLIPVTGTITGGGSNAFAGYTFNVAGFVAHTVNNGTFLCVASSATTLTLVNASGVAETHAGTATDPGWTYHFYTGDAGKTISASYVFTITNINTTEIDLIPGSGNVTPTTTFWFNKNIGVSYYGGAKDGQALTLVSGTPTVTGTYSFSVSNHVVTYHFSSGDHGAVVLLEWQYQDASIQQQGESATLNYQMFGGSLGQSVSSWLTGAFPTEALPYSNTAYVLYQPMFLGDSGQIQDNNFEVLTADAYGAGIYDCNPIQCIGQVLTNSVWGLGAGATPFPSSCIDNASNGTWGGPAATAGTRTSGSNAWNWFAANGFFISTIIDSQDTAASIVSKWLEAGMCAAFMSEGLFKLVPYGDTSMAGNGATWVAPSSFVVALDDTCYVEKEGEDPVKIERTAWQDAYNECQVQWSNRGNQYAPEITPESDQAAINRFGLRKEDPQNWDFITTTPAATFAANLRVKRGVNIRNAYTFTLPFSYSYLEPMDVLYISTSSVWAAGLNNTNLGITNLPVRVTKIVDDPVSGLEMTCEDYPWGAHQPVLFNKGIAAGQVVQTTTPATHFTVPSFQLSSAPSLISCVFAVSSAFSIM